MIQLKKILTLYLAVVLLNLSAVQADDTKVEAHNVVNNIYMITGKGGNIGLFTGPDGSFMIDDQYAPLTDKILEAIKSVGADTPDYLLNTHFHGDHTGGNENMGKKGTLFVSHHNVRKSLENGYVISEFGMKQAPANKVALPTITYSKKMVIHINGETVKIIHVPTAHTDGDSFVWFKNANVVHAGDLFFNGFYPFIDGHHGGSLRGMIRGVKKILEKTNDDTKIIPGHGPMADRKQLQAYLDMLSTAYERLLKLKNQGLSAEEAAAKNPLADLESEWGDGIFSGEKWIKTIYPAIF